jgi:hypothetical protein
MFFKSFIFYPPYLEAEKHLIPTLSIGRLQDSTNSLTSGVFLCCNDTLVLETCCSSNLYLSKNCQAIA